MDAAPTVPPDISAILRSRLGSARGRLPSPLFSMSIVRELTVEDIESLIERPHGALGSTTPPLVKIRATHHALARLLAEGRKAVEASAILGYSQSRISILQHDPAFQELIEHYRAQVREKYLDVHERLADLGVTAVEELRERLDDAPKTFSNRELLDITETTMDRTVAPTKSAKSGFGMGTGAPPSVNVNIKFVKTGPAPVQIEGEVDHG